MKLLLQGVHTKLFFRSGNIWTSNPEAAFDFQFSPGLSEFLDRHHLRDVQLVVKFEQPPRYEVVPLESVAGAL